MEEEMRLNLSSCAEAFAKARGLGLSVVGLVAARDGSFFIRLENDRKGFTVRKYDKVIAWFSANWPENAEWPSEVKRPESPKAKRKRVASAPDKAAEPQKASA